VNEINSQTLEKNIKKTVRVVNLNKCKCCHPKLGAHQTSIQTNSGAVRLKYES